MQRLQVKPRRFWRQRVEQMGFGFHSTDIPYWDESICYQFTMEQIEALENATAELWEMCLKAVQSVIDRQLYNLFEIPTWAIPQLEKSWNDDLPSIYGRFDFAYKDGQIKMLEFNADTPTTLFEAGIVQWFWLQDRHPDSDQFNSIHEKLIEYWKRLRPHLQQGPLYFSCVQDNIEDFTTVQYMRDCATQAGIDTAFIYIEDIGWNEDQRYFADMDKQPMGNIFKLYPYEWMLQEEFGRFMIEDSMECIWIEPLWKMILSNKAILPILWELFPNHPLLLEAYFEPKHLTSYARKPILSREGANIKLVKNAELLEETDGDYGAEGYIYQALFELPEYEGHYPLIGSWIIGQEPAGIGIREADRLITDNKSRFVPHLIG